MRSDRRGNTGVIVVIVVLAVGILLAILAKSCRPGPDNAPTPSAAPVRAPAAAPVQVPGAVLRGRVVFVGEVPERRRIDVTKDEAKCACDLRTGERQAFKFDESLVVDPATKGVAHAVVWVKEAGPGPAISEAVIDQKACEFAPHVALLTPGGHLKILNPERIDHNFHVWCERNDVSPANIPVPKMRTSVRVPSAGGLDRPEIFKATCDIHSWMSCWIAVVETGYAAVTDAEGRFSIPDAPAGEVTLAIWHETLAAKSLERKVSLAPPAGEVEIALQP